MTTEELQAALDRATAALEKANASITKLETKNEEIIGKLKAADARADEAEEQAKAPSTELEKAIKRAEKAEKAIADADARTAQVQQSLRTERGDAALSKMIAGANVDSNHVNLLTKALKASLEYGDDGQPMIDGQSVDDYGKAFFSAKGEGAHYVRAANNGGGVVKGHDGTRASATPGEWSLSGYTQMKQSDPAGAAAWAKSAGHEYLNSVS